VSVNSSEAFAKACFDRLAAPLSLRPVLDQSQGQHDFDVIAADGLLAGVVEVTSSVNSAYVSVTSEIVGREPHGDRVPSVECVSSWHVTARLDTRINRVRRDLDAYLRRLELAGLDSFSRGNRHPEATSIRNDLRLQSGRVIQTRHGTGHWIGIPVLSGWLDSSEVCRAVSAAASRPDNHRKLSNPAHPSRHLFVYVDMSDVDAWSALTSEMPAGLAPQVAGPTHLWAGSHDGTKSGAIVWNAVPGGSWTRHHLSLE